MSNLDQSSFINEQRHLHELLAKGAITQEEFEERKQKLLNEVKESARAEIHNVPSESSLNEKREVSFLLYLGILFLPIIFVWYLLRKGHSTPARIIGFVYFSVTFPFLFFCMFMLIYIMLISNGSFGEFVLFTFAYLGLFLQWIFG
ncbi:SHOCT domain-containing protein [Neisseriaceae bacterium ESL0693]|nr:SHOCT domain-containing protein [Neisseriaceae bacterium ESL0693]